MNLPPYQPRPNETLLEKCARLKRELQAAARSRGRAANDNEPARCSYWWERDGDPA